MAAPAHRCALGLGCVTFGREIDAAASFAIMDDAVRQGITFFDTASAYSNGGSERIVGQWLKTRAALSPLPEVATKVLPPYTAESITRSVQESLTRLQATQIDLLFFHRWDDTLDQPGPYSVLKALMEQGLVRAIGLSNVTAPQLAKALQWQAIVGLPSFQWLQNIHNFAVRGFDDEIRSLCRDSGIRLMGYSPLGAGFLTGKHQKGVAPGSRFEVIPGHQAVYFHPQSQQRLARLEDASLQTGRSMVELALAWAVHQPWIDLVLVGGRNSSQISQIQAARDSVPTSMVEALETP